VNNLHPPLIVHLIHRLAVGGLENGLVNLVNNLPPDRFRHSIICLTDFDSFRDRIKEPGVEVYALHKREGKDFSAYIRLWRLLRRLRPDVLHTRTEATFDAQFYAALAGVPVRIHGEHGQLTSAVSELTMSHKVVRRSLRPLVHHYITVSQDLANYLVDPLGISPSRVTRIYNGVDTDRFYPRNGIARIGPSGFADSGSFVIGTVGRMQPVKDQLTLVRAFVRMIHEDPSLRQQLRLVLIGDGPLREKCLGLLAEANASNLAWLPGERKDIPELLRGIDLFVLPSLTEGTSNTILEAMASGIPVVATRVGGNVELVRHGITGTLVEPSDPIGLAAAMLRYRQDLEMTKRQGGAARKIIETEFTLSAMIENYVAVYETVLGRVRPNGYPRRYPAIEQETSAGQN
jgi:sugar transferase (PEP-CTERM/EpsH1 system associated)